MGMTMPPTMVEDLLEDHGSLHHDRLVAAVAQGDVGLETVTDEVLLLCGRDALAGPQDHWTPWLLRQPDEHVEVARTTTLRWLLSRGLFTVGGALLLTGNPVTMGAGAVIVAGVVVYDNWDTISSWGSSAANAVDDAGRGLVNGAKKLFGGLF